MFTFSNTSHIQTYCLKSIKFKLYIKQLNKDLRNMRLKNLFLIIQIITSSLV